MKFEDLDFFILTCDRTLRWCNVFQKIYSQIKLPNTKVYFLGYKNPTFEMKENFYFKSLNDIDPGPKCTTYIKKFFQNYQKEYFILNVEDQIPIIQDNLKCDLLCDYIENEKNIGRFGLTQDIKRSTSSVAYKEIDGIKYIKVKENSKYKLSLVPSIWNKKFFLEQLEDNQDLWQFETIQNSKCMLDQYSVQGFDTDYIIDTTHLFKKGKFKESTYTKGNWTGKTVSENFIKIIDDELKTSSLK